jgi:hypothetical protein
MKNIPAFIHLRQRLIDLYSACDDDWSAVADILGIKYEAAIAISGLLHIHRHTLGFQGAYRAQKAVTDYIKAGGSVVRFAQIRNIPLAEAHDLVAKYYLHRLPYVTDQLKHRADRKQFILKNMKEGVQRPMNLPNLEFFGLDIDPDTASWVRRNEFIDKLVVFLGDIPHAAKEMKITQSAAHQLFWECQRVERSEWSLIVERVKLWDAVLYTGSMDRKVIEEVFDSADADTDRGCRFLIFLFLYHYFSI